MNDLSFTFAPQTGNSMLAYIPKVKHLALICLLTLMWMASQTLAQSRNQKAFIPYAWSLHYVAVLSHIYGFVHVIISPLTVFPIFILFLIIFISFILLVVSPLLFSQSFVVFFGLASVLKEDRYGTVYSDMPFLCKAGAWHVDLLLVYHN